ncbi:TPA: hypothetical protein JD360_20210 [Providencia stuartii]|nr:hypothetical protein [Providencia stuartii]HAU5775518.1 hypothetical protein [Providencia stuartii]
MFAETNFENHAMKVRFAKKVNSDRKEIMHTIAYSNGFIVHKSVQINLVILSHFLSEDTKLA